MANQDWDYWNRKHLEEKYLKQKSKEVRNMLEAMKMNAAYSQSHESEDVRGSTEKLRMSTQDPYFTSTHAGPPKQFQHSFMSQRSRIPPSQRYGHRPPSFRPPPPCEDDGIDRFSDCSFPSQKSRGRINRRFQGRRGFARGGTDSHRPGSDSGQVSVDKIVHALSDSESFAASLVMLMDNYNLNFKSVRAIANEHNHIFQLDGERVALKPTLSICQDHLKDGCSNLKACKFLHICINFVNGKCSDKECLYGHAWKTNHNNALLNKHCLGSLNKDRLSNLFKVSAPTPNTLEPIEVCIPYNSKSCATADCEKLHICLCFLAQRCSPSCTLSHNLSDDVLLCILKKHQIDVNESPKDIINSIRSRSSIKKQLESMVFKENSPSHFEENANESTSFKTEATKPKSKALPKQVVTLWSDCLKGDVTKSEICYASVESICPYEERGCWRLHSCQHFHWQVREQGKEWLNLPLEQVNALERAYCNPEKESTLLPGLNPATLGKSLRFLLSVMGRKSCEADFDNMLLQLPETNHLLELRRLITEPTDNEMPDPGKFSWYFLDVNQKWVEYGNIDTAKKENLRSNMDSKAIEAQYSNDATALINFSNAEFHYTLDPVSMVQTNLNTKVVRKVRRRPRPHLAEEKKEAPPTHGMLDAPGYWEAMSSDERNRRVTLAPSSGEYQRISSLFASKGGNYNLLKIERLQNPYLWRAFKIKEKEIESLYKDPAEVNVQQLFHGTHPNIVDNICKENFEWRLPGSNNQQTFGRGTYFVSDANASYLNATPDSANSRIIFVAKVIIGRVTLGSPSMTRPPINPTTNVPFESTVDNVANPTIIVKYDKQEYYPEYILTVG